MSIRLSVIATACAGLVAGCASLPPGLAPEPDARSIAVYVPAAAGQPARIDLIPAPDNSWRTPAQPDEVHLAPLMLAGDGGAAIRKLADILADAESRSPDDVAVGLGPPPIADMDGARLVIERIDRRCEAADGVARLPQVRDRICSSPQGRYEAWRLPVAAAGLDIADLRATLARAGYRDQGATPPNINLHPPHPGTESLFVPARGDPVVVVSHLREGPPGPAHVTAVTVIWRGSSAR